LVTAVKTVIASGGINTATDYAATLTDATVSVADVNTVAADTSGVVTATLVTGALADFASLSTASTDVISITVNDAGGSTLSASTLATLGGKSAGTVTVQNAVTISGTAAELIAALVTTGTKVVAALASVTITDAPTVSQYQQIAAVVGGTISYTSITDTAANLAADAVTGTPVITNKTVVVSDTGSVSAANLKAISAVTTSTVTVGSASEITGTASDLVTVISDSGISKSGSIDYTATSSATVVQATTIYGAVTTGDKSYSIVDQSAVQTASSAVLAAATSVTYNGTSTPNTMDMSGYTLSNLTINGLANADTLYGSLGNDTINGGTGADHLEGLTGNDSLTGGSGADSYVFSESAAANGADTIEVVVGDGDILNFNQFLDGGAVDQNGSSGTAISVHTTSETSETDITSKISLFDTNGTGLSVADLVAQFAAGKAYALDADGKAVVITGDASSSANSALVYFVDNSLDGDDGVSETDVTLVATTSANFDLDTLTTSNFIA